MATPAATRLRALLAEPNTLITAPGVFDGLTARLALHAGFQCLYMTGAGTSISRTGMADLGLTTMTEMKETAEMICGLDRRVPVIADADTGYGGTLNVRRTVEAYIRAGVAGFHLEDQVVNKKCGHLEGKEVVGVEEFAARIRAAVETRRMMGSNVVIIARTDALQMLGLDAALERLRVGVEEGADVVMLEAITKREEVEAVTRMFGARGVPVLYGMVQGSTAYRMTQAEARVLGVKITVYAAACLAPIQVSVLRALRSLKEDECEDYGAEMTPHRLFDICGMQELLEFDRCVAGSDKVERGPSRG